MELNASSRRFSGFRVVPLLCWYSAIRGPRKTVISNLPLLQWESGHLVPMIVREKTKTMKLHIGREIGKNLVYFLIQTLNTKISVVSYVRVKSSQQICSTVTFAKGEGFQTIKRRYELQLIKVKFYLTNELVTLFNNMVNHDGPFRENVRSNEFYWIFLPQTNQFKSSQQSTRWSFQSSCPIKALPRKYVEIT